MKIKHGLFVLIIIVVAISCLFLLKNSFFEYYISKKISTFTSKYDCTIRYGSVKLNGFSELIFENLLIAPKNCDTLLTCYKIDVKFNLINLFTGDNPLNDIHVKDANISLINKNRLSNFSRFLKNNKISERELIQNKKNNTKTSIQNFLEKIFDLSSERKLSFDNINLMYQNDSIDYGFHIQKLNYSNKKINASLSENDRSSVWNLSGNIDNKRSSLSFKLSQNNKSEQLLILKKIMGINFGFNNGSVQIYYSNENNNVQLKISGNINELEIYHPKLSTKLVKLKHFQTDIIAVLDDYKLSLKSVKPTLVNQLPLCFSATYTYSPSKKYEVEINTSNVNANTFISSFPTGLLSNFDKLELDGKLRYSLDFMLDDLNPDSCRFFSTLIPDNVKIKKTGNCDFGKINNPFDHPIIEKGKYIRTQHVGENNPNYYPLENISSYLKTTIMTAEDGAFMWHKGFNEDAFRKSIAENYMAGRFSRGGSTITMQLVKNIFLNKNKTISRKLEEALIVWLIENMHLCSKERMFEVYLNIIEFGPNIYGIGEASKFYFNKKPAMLNLSESVFLSSIVPRPKYFKYFFDKNLNLKPFMTDTYNFMGKVLKKRNLISENEFNDLKPEIELIGPARKYIASNDSLPKDFYDEQIHAE